MKFAFQKDQKHFGPKPVETFLSLTFGRKIPADLQSKNDLRSSGTKSVLVWLVNGAQVVVISTSLNLILIFAICLLTHASWTSFNYIR